nr:RecQ family zinc-binding domain-containing protein [Deinococcus irradiatisoli]
MADQLDVIMATTALGMGIDKPNVRFVCHLDRDGSLDADTQEIRQARWEGEARRPHCFFHPAIFTCASRTRAGSGANGPQPAGSCERSGSAAGPGSHRYPPDVVAEATLAHERRRAFERSQLEMLRGYAETPGCRQAFLLYCDEAYTPPCHRCDNCEAGQRAEVPGQAKRRGPSRSAAGWFTGRSAKVRSSTKRTTRSRCC